MHPQRQAVWGDIWKHTVEKGQTNATNVAMHLLRQAIWGFIWKHTVEKSQTNAISVWHLRTHSGEKLNKCSQCDFASSEAANLRRHLETHSGKTTDKCNHCNADENAQWEKGKTMQPMRLCLLWSKYIEDTFKEIVEKNQTNTTNITLHLLRQVISGDI